MTTKTVESVKQEFLHYVGSASPADLRNQKQCDFWNDLELQSPRWLSEGEYKYLKKRFMAIPLA
jgi:hypothetical protein